MKRMPSRIAPMVFSIVFPIALTLVLVVTLSAAPAWSQETDAGRVDLGPVADAIGQTPKVNINFGPAMMAGFAETLAGSSQELGEVIRSIAGLRLMVFEDIGDADVSGPVDETAEALRQAGWTAAIEVRDDDARVDLYLNESQQFVEGLVLMVTEQGGDAVLANIFGDLDPVVIGKLVGSGEALRNLDFDALTEQFESMSDDGESASDDES